MTVSRPHGQWNLVRSPRAARLDGHAGGGARSSPGRFAQASLLALIAGEAVAGVAALLGEVGTFATLVWCMVLVTLGYGMSSAVGTRRPSRDKTRNGAVFSGLLLAHVWGSFALPRYCLFIATIVAVAALQGPREVGHERRADAL